MEVGWLQRGAEPARERIRAAEALHDHLRETWPTLREQLLAGIYRPQPVKRQLIPKSDGGERELGIPTALDRFIQQALL